MAVWTIKKGIGTAGSGTQLEDSKIVATQSGGNTTYQFIGRGSSGGPTTNSNPPNFKKVAFAGQTWRISSSIIPPTSPANGAKWGGSCATSSALPEDDPGTWSAEATGGTTVGGKGKGKGKKSAKSAKGTNKKSAKATSKKTAKGTKATSKKGAKSVSKKGASKKGTKGTKKTRGRA